MAIIKAENYTFTYPGSREPSLDEVSFTVEGGEVIGIIGPMGAGKTTLCLAMAGLVPHILGGRPLALWKWPITIGSDNPGRHQTGRWV